MNVNDPPQYAVDDVAWEYNSEPLVILHTPPFFEVGNVQVCNHPLVGAPYCVPAGKYTVVVEEHDQQKAQAYVNAKAQAELAARSHFASISSGPITITQNAQVGVTTLPVIGLLGSVTKVVLVLNGLNLFDTSSFVYLLLQSPSGQVCNPFGDGGCTNTASNVLLTLDDAAANQLPVCPSVTPLSTGTFRPNSDNTSSLFPPAPPGPYAIPLSTLNGSTPNGNWKFYYTSFITTNSPTLPNGITLQITTV